MTNCGLYIHIPFCEKRCNYCNFFSSIKDEEIIGKYVKNLCDEIRLISSKIGKCELQTIYIGGGTPSLLSISSLEDIFSAIYSSFNVNKKAEITIEINPSSSNDIKTYKKIGINRVSIGVQSLNDKTLNKLGRIHTADMAIKTLNDASEHFENVSADLILGADEYLPINDFNIIVPYVKHISAYMLTLEEGTKLYNDILNKVVSIATEDRVIQEYESFVNIARDKGFERYETSNFAQKGYESRHNSSYWNLTPYLGVGAGAHSYFNGRRYYNEANINKYCSGFHSGNGNEILERKPDIQEDKYEYVMLSLRTVNGINLDEYKNRFGTSFLDDYKKGIKKSEKYLNVSNKTISINSDYFLLQNSIIFSILD